MKFGRKRPLTDDRVKEIRTLRELGQTAPAVKRIRPHLRSSGTQMELGVH